MPRSFCDLGFRIQGLGNIVMPRSFYDFPRAKEGKEAREVLVCKKSTIHQTHQVIA